MSKYFKHTKKKVIFLFLSRFFENIIKMKQCVSILEYTSYKNILCQIILN